MSTEAYDRKRVTKKGVIQRINAVKEYIFLPCDPTLGVYVETVFEPAGELLITLLSFGMDDVVRGYARPKNIRKQKRYRGKRPRTVRIGGKRVKLEIPELGERIGEAIRPDSVHNRTVSNGVKNLWVIDGLLQRALWYWLVADAGSEFAYDWSSAIIKEECTPPRALLGRGLFTGTGTQTVGANVLTPIQWGAPKTAKDCSVSQFNWKSKQLGIRWRIVFVMTISTTTPLPVQIPITLTFRVGILFSPNFHVESKSVVLPKDGGEVSFDFDYNGPAFTAEVVIEPQPFRFGLWRKAGAQMTIKTGTY